MRSVEYESRRGSTEDVTQQRQHISIFISSRYKKKGAFKVNLLPDMILNVLKFKYTITSIYLVYIYKLFFYFLFSIFQAKNKPC